MLATVGLGLDACGDDVVVAVVVLLVVDLLVVVLVVVVVVVLLVVVVVVDIDVLAVVLGTLRLVKLICDLKTSVGETEVVLTLGLLVEIILGSAKCLVSSVGLGIGIGLNCFGTCGKAWLLGNLLKAGERLRGRSGDIGLMFCGGPRNTLDPKPGMELGPGN